MSFRKPLLFSLMPSSYALVLLLVFSVHATDLLGGSVDSSPNSKKINVAVLDITGSFKDFTRNDLRAISARFETELMNTEVYQVLERQNMDMILQEQGFQQSGACNTSECQVEMGQLLGVEKIISGNIFKMDKLITINLKMVDVSSGKNQLSYALDTQGGLETVLRGACWELAQIFAGKKKPEGNRIILAAKNSSIWPWILGGLALTATGSAAYLFLDDRNAKDDYSVDTGF